MILFSNFKLYFNVRVFREKLSKISIKHLNANIALVDKLVNLKEPELETLNFLNGL